MRLAFAAVLVATGWLVGSVQHVLDNGGVTAVLLSPALGGVAGVAAAGVGGATALAIARRDREQREKAERRAQWWARARWALDLLMEDDAKRRIVGYGVLKSLADGEWSGEHEAGLVAAAMDNAVSAFRKPARFLGTKGLR